MEADSGDEAPPVDKKVQQNVEEKTDDKLKMLHFPGLLKPHAL